MITGWKHDNPQVQYEFERLYRLIGKGQTVAAEEAPRSRSSRTSEPPVAPERVRQKAAGLIELDNVIEETVMSDYGALQYETIILPFALTRPGQYHMVLIVANPNTEVYDNYEVLRLVDYKDGDHEGNMPLNKITIYARNCGNAPSTTTLLRDLTAPDENPQFYYMICEAWDDEAFPTHTIRTWQSVRQQYIDYMMHL